MNDDGFYAVQVPALGTIDDPQREAPPGRARNILLAGSLVLALCVGGFGLGRSLAGNHEPTLGTGVSQGQTHEAPERQDSGPTTAAQAPAENDEGPGEDSD